MAHLFKRLVVVGLALAGIGAEPAAAGTFHVYGLGLNSRRLSEWLAGLQTFSPQRFRQGARTGRSSRPVTARRSGPASSRGRASTPATAPRFTGFSIRSRGVARNGTVWKMAMCATPFAGCRTIFPALGRDVGRAGVRARHRSARQRPDLREAPVRGRDVRVHDVRRLRPSEGRAVQVTHTESHAVVDDFTPPGSPSLSGVSTGWNAGQRRLAYAASDAGGGIASARADRRRLAASHNRPPCSRLPAGGYPQAVPCATATRGVRAERGGAAGRRSALAHRDLARRGRGEQSTTQEFWVDNNAPGTR